MSFFLSLTYTISFLCVLCAFLSSALSSPGSVKPVFSFFFFCFVFNISVDLR